MSDNWLERWTVDIKHRTGTSLVLELGCGSGRDTKILTDAGCEVIATDISSGSLAECKVLNPSACLVQLDISSSLPFAADSINVLLASLSLHYFDWESTLSIEKEIARCLKPGGLLIARLNAVNDRNFGAGQGQEIEPNYYRWNEGNKRFFDKQSVMSLLSDWRIDYVEEKEIDRYRKSKCVWEIVATHA